MEKKKKSLNETAGNVGKAALGFLNKAKEKVVSTIDQNGDGKLDFSDVNIVSDTVKSVVKDSGDKLNEKMEERRKKKELEALRPLFDLDLEKPDYSLPKLLRLAEMDEKHAESELCLNSIGFVFPSKNLDVTTLYPNKITNLNLKFYPDRESEVYYVDPADRDLYISLDEYFKYIRVKRVAELQAIAQSLGAKHFRVTYKDYNKNTHDNSVKGKANAKNVSKESASAEFEHSSHSSYASEMEVVANMEFIGHEPRRPELHYFVRDPQIQLLIDMRMADNTLKHQQYTLQLIDSSGIKVRDAGKIDAALSTMKISTSATVTSLAESESRRYFEYEIDF